jgi:hypothetical protein
MTICHHASGGRTDCQAIRLRHPAVIISIGDKDSSKNARIVQRVVFVAGPSKKESALREVNYCYSSHGFCEEILLYLSMKRSMSMESAEWWSALLEELVWYYMEASPKTNAKRIVLPLSEMMESSWWDNIVFAEEVWICMMTIGPSFLSSSPD